MGTGKDKHSPVSQIPTSLMTSMETGSQTLKELSLEYSQPGKEMISPLVWLQSQESIKLLPGL